MKKKTLFDCFLAVIPVAAFFLATTGDSVTVYDLTAQEVRSLSYFAPAVGATVSFLTPFAGMLTGVAAVLALVLVIGKKAKLAAWLKWISLAAAVAGVAPLFLQGDVRVVPNFMLPLLMMVEFALCFFSGKQKTHMPKEPRGERLG